MRVLVTGGGGFIGSAVTAGLLDAGDEVVAVDRDPAHVDPRAELLVADLALPEAAARAVVGIDVVCHQAARVGLGLDFTDAPAYVRDNDLATAQLLSALSSQGFQGRFVLASSMVVYGEGRYRCESHGIVRPEARQKADLEAGRFDPPCPTCGAPLGWSGVPEDAQEHLCALWARETGASVVALRYHNVYGPRLPVDTPYAGVAALFRSSLRRGEAPKVFEDGQQARDFVHVADVARANLLAIEVQQAAGSATAANICSGQPRTIAAVAEAFADSFGPDAPRPVITGEFRLGDVRHIVASPERARTWLGFSAEVSFAEGVAELAAEGDPVSSFESNP